MRIKIDELGTQMYKLSSRAKPTVEGFLNFAKTTKWEILRDFLVNALTLKWKERSSKEQFGILRDLMMLTFQPAHEKHDVVTLWRRIENEVKGVVRIFQSVLNAQSNRVTDRYILRLIPLSYPGSRRSFVNMRTKKTNCFPRCSSSDL